jgi:hypothetical protein
MALEDARFAHCARREASLSIPARWRGIMYPINRLHTYSICTFGTPSEEADSGASRARRTTHTHTHTHPHTHTHTHTHIPRVADALATSVCYERGGGEASPNRDAPNPVERRAQKAGLVFERTGGW